MESGIARPLFFQSKTVYNVNLISTLKFRKKWKNDNLPKKRVLR